MILCIGGFADACPLPSPLTMTNTNTARRPRLPRTMADLASHPWVDEISDERSCGAGIWVYLKPGYVWEGVSAIHENTVKDCCQAIRFVYFDQYVFDYLEAVPAPAEAAPVEAAPVEAVTAEAAPAEAVTVEAVTVEAAPLEAAIGRYLELIARAVAAVAVAVYAAGLTLGAAVHALNDWLAGVAPAAPAPAPAPARVAPPAVHPFAVITAAALDGLTGAAVAVAV